MSISTKTTIRSSSSTVYSLILEQIMNFKLKPGEVITEVSLSAQFGISRTPVREAIKKLENEGLIITENRTKKIYYLTTRDIEDIFDLKIAIESSVARTASVSGTKEQKAELKKVISIFQKLIKERSSGIKDEITFFSEWLKTDQEFHKLLFAMAGNTRAEQFISVLNVQWHRIKMGILAIEGRVERGAIEHSEIGEAVISGNRKEAEEAVRDHLTNLKIVLIGLMNTFNY